MSPPGLLDVFPDAVLLIDGSESIVFANAAVRKILGHRPERLSGRPLSDLLPERYRELHARNVAEFRASKRSTAMSDRPVLLALHASGEEVPVSISIANVDLTGDQLTLAVIRDAAPVWDRLGKATATAESDSLTGLGNRLALTRRVGATIEAKRAFGLLFLDLTQFKVFNDEHGHLAGDELLRLVGRRLSALVRADDVAVRLGGDEFVLLLDGLSNPLDLQARLRDVEEKLEKPFRLRGVGPASTGVDIGGALYPQDGESEVDLLAVADERMYRAKGRRPGLDGPTDLPTTDPGIGEG